MSRISLILPYWDRAGAADESLRLLARTYPSLDLEVVLVDDGTPEPYHPPAAALPVTLVRLPLKHEPKSPCTPWNAGVAASSGRIVVLSCIEILHTAPVLEQLADDVERRGPDAYVLAAAWCPEQTRWHCHSSVVKPGLPPGAGLGFCAALHRELFHRAGGFDERYRDGAGYEDDDFAWRLHRAGAQFSHRDDLVVTHPKRGARINWGAAKFARNEQIYRSTWFR